MQIFVSRMRLEVSCLFSIVEYTGLCGNDVQIMLFGATEKLVGACTALPVHRNGFVGPPQTGVWFPTLL